MSMKKMPEDVRQKTILAFKALFEDDDEALAELRRIEQAERTPDLLDRVLESRYLFWIGAILVASIVCWLAATMR